MAVPIGGDVRAGVALGEDEAHFLRAVDVHDRHEDEPAHRQPVERDDRLAPVGHLKRDGVTGLEAGVRERGDELQCLGAHLGVSAVPRPRLRPDVHLGVRGGRERSLDQLPECVVGPPTVLEVAGAQLGWNLANGPRHSKTDRRNGPMRANASAAAGKPKFTKPCGWPAQQSSSTATPSCCNRRAYDAPFVAQRVATAEHDEGGRQAGQALRLQR